MLCTATMLTSENESSDDTPRIRVMFVMQLPSRFPRAMLTYPCFRAWMVVASSGKDVPSPMIVAPIIDEGNPMKSAISMELSTANLDKRIISATPAMNLMLTAARFSFLFGVGFSFVGAVFSVFREIVTPKYANNVSSTMPSTGPRLPLWTMNRGIIDEMNRNCTSSLFDCPFSVIVFLASSIASPRIMVRLATFEPRTFPTESPPSPPRDATTETESSGSEVMIERRMKPAAISDSPMALDMIRTYRMIRSLISMMSSNDIASRGML
jgi:hypothetical protein